MIKTFLQDGLSINETRISALIVCLVIVICLAAYQVFAFNDITENVKNIIYTLTAAIASINISKNLKNKEEVKDA